MSPPPPGSAPLSLAERFASTLTAHDIKGFAALFSDEYINHQHSAASASPVAGMTSKQMSVALYKGRLDGIADLKVTIEAMVADGSQVAASFVYAGTHSGPLMGVGPTHRAIRFTSCDIFRAQDGLLVEHWGMGDIAGLVTQLNA